MTIQESKHISRFKNQLYIKIQESIFREAHKFAILGSKT